MMVVQSGTLAEETAQPSISELRRGVGQGGDIFGSRFTHQRNRETVPATERLQSTTSEQAA